MTMTTAMTVLRDYWFILGPVASWLAYLGYRAGIRLVRQARRWGHQARIAWARFGEMSDQVTRIDRMLKPNGGDSVVDRLCAIELTGAQIKGQNAEIEKRMAAGATQLAALRARIDADQRTAAEPRLELDAAGFVVSVNRAFEDLTDRGAGDLIGLGLFGVVHRDDRHRVVTELQHAVADRRWFEMDLRLMIRDGSSRQVRMYAEPMRGAADNAVLGWLVMCEKK